MIVDIHTHIFPPALIQARSRLAERDPAFAEIYADPKAKMATAGDLLDSMAEAGVDASVACGFWWGDAAVAADHAAYLVESAAGSGGRIIAFVSGAPMPGAAGVGEVRERDPAHIEAGALPLLVHASEEAGHQYRGKAGGLSPGALWELLADRPQARVIAAHWGGGMPFLALMPEVRALIDDGRLIFDTAATAYLYSADAYRLGFALAGPGGVAWGSDFPLRSQSRDRAEVEAALPDAAQRAAVLGENAARFLGIVAPGAPRA
ncbi:MAG: amidohydrolase family protein [Chloroflexi bacterium]|nr:amidohydrolase family protein [Chloroflexota bacterium]